MGKVHAAPVYLLCTSPSCLCTHYSTTARASSLRLTLVKSPLERRGIQWQRLYDRAISYNSPFVGCRAGFNGSKNAPEVQIFWVLPAGWVPCTLVRKSPLHGWGVPNLSLSQLSDSRSLPGNKTTLRTDMISLSNFIYKEI